MQQYLTEKDVAAMTKRALSTLRNDRYLRRGIPYTKIGRSVRYSMAAVLDFIDRRRVDVNESD